MITARTFAAAIALALFAAPAAAESTSVPAAPDRAATETIIRDYILAHPEIISEAMQVLEDRQRAQVIRTNRKAIETPFGSAWEGDAKGDVTLVEFFDYNCGYCRASVADVARLLKEDKRLKIVYRELPVLGAQSDAAALASLAFALGPGDWPAFHRAVFASGDASAANLAKAQRVAGLSAASVAPRSPALRDQINANLALAQQLRISGTPSWVVGNKLLGGAVGYEEFKAAIAAARAHKGG